MDHRLAALLCRLLYHRRHLLLQSPAEGHLQRLLIEQLCLLLPVDGVVEFHAVHLLQQLQRLYIGLGIGGIEGVSVVGKSAAVQIGHQCPGAVVAVLTGAVHGGHRLTVLAVQRLDGLGKLLRCPGAALQIHILVGAGVDECGVVDGHALHIHGQGIDVAGAVRGKAGALADVVDLLLVGVVPEIGQIHQHTLSAPYLHQLFRPRQQHVRRLTAVHGGAQLAVAGGLVQTLYRYMDVGIQRVELPYQLFHGGFVAPVSCGICPQ